MLINPSTEFICGVFIKWDKDKEVFYLDGPDGMYTELCDYDCVNSYAEYHGLQYIELGDPPNLMLGVSLAELDQYEAQRHVSVSVEIPPTVAAYAAEYNLPVFHKLILSIEE
jgi:hypothetical protein